MANSSSEKSVGINLQMPEDAYRKLKILSAIHGSGGARNEALDAVLHWIEKHEKQLPDEGDIIRRRKP